MKYLIRRYLNNSFISNLLFTGQKITHEMYWTSQLIHLSCCCLFVSLMCFCSVVNGLAGVMATVSSSGTECFCSLDLDTLYWHWTLLCWMKTCDTRSLNTQHALSHTYSNIEDKRTVHWHISLRNIHTDVLQWFTLNMNHTHTSSELCLCVCCVVVCVWMTLELTPALMNWRWLEFSDTLNEFIDLHWSF